MGTGPGDLHGLAEEFLAACIAALDTIPNYEPLGGAPLRAFVGPGPPAFDCCDQLAVHVGTINSGSTAGAVGNINRVELVATATRCVPMPDDNGRPPPPSELSDSAAQINADKWALWVYLHMMVTDGLLFERCCEVIWGSIAPLTPSGGCGGSRLTVAVCFDGYEAVPTT